MKGSGDMTGTSSGVLGGQGAQGNASRSSSSSSWAKVVSGNKTPSPEAKKMNLNYVQLVMLEGRPKVVTAAAIVVEGAKR